MKDEKKMWILVGGIFAATLLCVDIWYSSWDLLMSQDMTIGICAAIVHLIVLCGWAVVLIKFEDPNWDYMRRVTIVATVAAIIIVGLHHAFHLEDQQVIIDSIENSKK